MKQSYISGIFLLVIRLFNGGNADNACPDPSLSKCKCSGNRDDYSVNCEGADLTKLPPGIPSYTVSFNMIENSIKLTEAMFYRYKLSNLRSLSLGDVIGYVPRKAFLGLGNLTNLSLVGHQITGFDKDAFQFLDKLSSLNVEGNSNLKCSCNLYGIINNLKKTRNDIEINGWCEVDSNSLSRFTPKEKCADHIERPPAHPHKFATTIGPRGDGQIEERRKDEFNNHDEERRKDDDRRKDEFNNHDDDSREDEFNNHDDHRDDHRDDERFNKADNKGISMLLICVSVTVSLFMHMKI